MHLVSQMKINDQCNQRAWRDLSEEQYYGHQHQDSFVIFQSCIKHCSALKPLRKPRCYFEKV